ncbi:MAG: NAD(P)/FAD-dependent oxidoreductase [Eubacteriales bacterium]|nr:NAD(P)/FAD-dependent oxidoreductase [Eubacteriales bacterium]
MTVRRMSMGRQVIITGGGASGLAAAIAAAREGAQVTVLEHMDRVGKKILSTGNGRCNMTNLSLKAEHYRCSQKQFPMKVLDRFSVWDTLTFFDEIGIITKSRNGYIYPNSDQASSVLDSLRLEAERLGVRMETGCRVARLAQNGKKGFLAETDRGDFFGDRLILACGSKAAPKTGSDGSGYELARGFGHRIITPLPALVQLRCRGAFLKQLAGIRCDAVVKLASEGRILAADAGELQLTDYGVSGIPVFQVSRFASVALHEGRRVSVLIDFLPSKSMEETRQFLDQRQKRLGYREAGDFLTGVFSKKLAQVLLKEAGIPLSLPVSQIRPRQAGELAGLIKQFSMEVTAANSFDQAQVCCGGVDTREIRPDTLESRLVRGLYLTGELLDVDGVCGGYNLQWAWSTGITAGRCAGGTDQ